jgi:hypothetical protein
MLYSEAAERKQRRRQKTCARGACDIDRTQLSKAQHSTGYNVVFVLYQAYDTAAQHSTAQHTAISHSKATLYARSLPSRVGWWCLARSRARAAMHRVASVSTSSSDAMEVQPGLRAAPSCAGMQRVRALETSSRTHAHVGFELPACYHQMKVNSLNGISSAHQGWGVAAQHVFRDPIEEAPVARTHRQHH